MPRKERPLKTPPGLLPGPGVRRTPGAGKPSIRLPVGSLHGSWVENGWRVTSACADPHGGPGGGSRKEGPHPAPVSLKLPEPLGPGPTLGRHELQKQATRKGAEVKKESKGNARAALGCTCGLGHGPSRSACACERRTGACALRALGGCRRSRGAWRPGWIWGHV